MRNYWTNDYAINKNCKGIIYQFADGNEMEITLTEYLQTNPGKTEQDFQELKILSDDIYHKQALEDTQYGKRKQSLGKLVDSVRFSTPSVECLLIHKNNQEQMLKATKLLLESSELTEVQRRRFIKHFLKGYSYRQIAAGENVHFTSTQESVEAAVKKLKKYLKNF